MGPTKLCGSHMNLVSLMWILTNQRYCVKKYMLECMLLAFLVVLFIKILSWRCGTNNQLRNISNMSLDFKQRAFIFNPSKFIIFFREKFIIFVNKCCVHFDHCYFWKDNNPNLWLAWHTSNFIPLHHICWDKINQSDKNFIT